MLDALERRKRDRPQPTGKIIVPTERYITWFEKLHRHGRLPASYLHEYTKHTHKNETKTKGVLTDLFHEDSQHGGPYLSRVGDKHFSLYHLTKSSLAVLKSESLYTEHAPTVTNWLKHDSLLSCVTSSIELATLREPDKYEYIFHDEIVARVGPLVFQDGALKPDRALGIRYKSGGVILFLLEGDCGTEPHTGKKRKTLERMVEHYKEFIGKGLYRYRFGDKASVVVLMAFNRPRRMERAMKLAEGAPYLLFRYVDGFGDRLRPPAPLLELLGPWERAGREPLNLREP